MKTELENLMKQFLSRKSSDYNSYVNSYVIRKDIDFNFIFSDNNAIRVFDKYYFKSVFEIKSCLKDICAFFINNFNGSITDIDARLILELSRLIWIASNKNPETIGVYSLDTNKENIHVISSKNINFIALMNNRFIISSNGITLRKLEFAHVSRIACQYDGEFYGIFKNFYNTYIDTLDCSKDNNNKK